MELTVRLAEDRDFDGLVEISAAFMDLSPMTSDKGADIDRIKNSIGEFLDDDRTIVVVAEEDASGIVGILVGIVSEHHGIAQVNAHEYYYFVRPAHQSKGVGRGLISLFEGEARKRGAENVYISAESGLDNETVSKKFRTFGYTPCGASFRKDLRVN